MDAKEVAKNLKNGAIFIYPGKESYEAACDIVAKASVERLLGAGKGCIFSVIAPNKAWIYKNLNANKRYIERLPGPFTFMLKAKKSKNLPKYSLEKGVLGVRLVDSEISSIAAKNNVLLFSCVIKKDGKLVIRPDAIPRSIKNAADFIVEEKILEIKPHIAIDLTGKVAKIV